MSATMREEQAEQKKENWWRRFWRRLSAANQKLENSGCRN
jgi:hypothetical protein